MVRVTKYDTISSGDIEYTITINGEDVGSAFKSRGTRRSFGRGMYAIDRQSPWTWELIADKGKWFTHDYWLDEANKPDFANCVDIHRKPGYDPRELFSEASMPAIAWKLLKKKLGFRQLMDVIPLDASLVQGTHGRIDNPPELQPVMLGGGHAGETLPCTAVRDVILHAMFD